MKDDTRQDEHGDRDELTLARLMRLAGPRAPVPEDVESRVYRRVQQEWRTQTEQPQGDRVYAQVRREWSKRSPRRGIGRWALPAAIAASVLLAIAVIRQPPPPVPAEVPVGSVVKVVGGTGSGALPLPGRLVYPGESLSTGKDQGLSLRLNDAVSLRIDEQTTLAVRGNNEFRLLQGRVYADTGDFIYRDRGLVILTSMGSVTDVGTQFSVDVDDALIDIAVREGRVDLSNDSEEWVAVAGERLTVHRDDGATTDTLAAHDPYWDWATSLAPAFDLDNKSLLDFLRWAARETGRELVFESDQLRMAAMRTDVHGSVADFDPLEALESVLATTTFKYRVEADRIVIEQ